MHIMLGFAGSEGQPVATTLRDSVLDRAGTGIVRSQSLRIVPTELSAELTHQMSTTIEGRGRVPGIDTHGSSGPRHKLSNTLRTSRRTRVGIKAALLLDLTSKEIGTDA